MGAILVIGVFVAVFGVPAWCEWSNVRALDKRARDSINRRN